MWWARGGGATCFVKWSCDGACRVLPVGRHPHHNPQQLSGMKKQRALCDASLEPEKLLLDHRNTATHK
ncbi:unnamed protein product [Ixodes persulcatus]